MIDNKKILTVITARKNSQGIQGKNYRLLLGRPLIVWSIMAALESRYTDLTLISTNCDEVKKVCEPYLIKDKIEICNRPDELATATSKNEEALLHACYYKKEFIPDIVVCLQPTSPYRELNAIDLGLIKMKESGLKSVLTVEEKTPFFVQKNYDQKTVWYFDRFNRRMRQQLSGRDMFYHDNGSMYIVNRDVLEKENCRSDINPYLLISDKLHSYQIDDEKDFVILEKIMESDIELKKRINLFHQERK